MDSITLKKAMSPYFTTKEHGTGLGLFIVNRIIIDHGGNDGYSKRTGVWEPELKFVCL